MTSTIADRILERLAAHRDQYPDSPACWLGVDQLLDLAPVTEQPVYAYRHELDDTDSGETIGFGQDATGVASNHPVRTEQRPDRDLIAQTLLELAAEGRIERGSDHGRLPYEYRIAR